MNGCWLASDPSWLSLLMLKQVQMTAFKKVCLWEVSKTLSREDRYLVCVVLCFCCIIFQNGTRALSAVSAALHASNAWLSIFFFLSVFNMKYSCGIFHPSTVESNNNNQFRLDFFFPAFLFFTSSKTLRFFSSPQFLVWAPSLCSSTLTCLLCPEEKVTNLWNEHVQNRHPTATHSYLCKPAITRTSSTRWTSSTTGAGWRDSSRIHTWARWKEAHFLRSII